MGDWASRIEAIAAASGVPAAECTAVLEDLHRRLAAENVDLPDADTAMLQRYLYTLALERAGSSRLARVVRVLRAYYGLLAPSGAANAAAALPDFAATETDRERLIRSQWGTSDLFYGVPPDAGGDEFHA
jgi:site-specific recombinase XerD